MTQAITIDPVYAQIDPVGTPLCHDVWNDKYRWDGESYADMMERVAKAVYAKDEAGQGTTTKSLLVETYMAMKANLWMPAGRILAGAGTPKRVTLLNCFVNAEIEDDMESITRGLANIMLTMQQGGGIGTDFTPMRPAGAKLFRTGASASGPGPFIDTWDSACTTIRSAGDRRGAMMGTLHCSHPYLPEFIRAKHEKGRWTNFNVSVLVSDAFMSAVQEDEEWYLYHSSIPNFDRPEEVTSMDFMDNDDVQQYVYSIHRARDLWDQLMRSTYEYAEPGVIFIDRVNDQNNLNYLEDISCTNPCGEQPLPPHGCCDLGAVNISRMVRAPFTEDATFDWELLETVTRLGVRFLDNVIDVTNYPLPEQRVEEENKRRIGLGVSGLADAMHFLGMRYGSLRSIEFAEKVMKTIAITAYDESANLAQEKGSFPLFDAKKFCAQPFIQKLPLALQAKIRKGMRNGVVLTIAPTGTTSIAYGNGSSGLEPVFAHGMDRKVKQADGSLLPYSEVAFGARLYLLLNPGTTLADLPSYMNVCADVRVHEHVRIQEVCQKWVDASISKTINLPTEISFEDFKDVYQLAYDSDCKGCTTYRPSEVRGSILTVTGSLGESAAVAGGVSAVDDSLPAERPEILTSQTAKIRWQGLDSALYLTIGYVGGRPYEVFLNSKDQKSMEWTMGLTLLMSMCLRKGISMETIATEFQEIHGLEGAWAPNRLTGKQKYWPSLIAYLGHFLEQMPHGITALESAPSSEALGGGQADQTAQQEHGMKCPSCKEASVINLSGCDTCSNCGWSKCS